MATIDELVKQYETDEVLQKEVADILADGKITMMEFLTFVNRHHVNVTPADLPRLREQARKMGFIE